MRYAQILNGKAHWIFESTTTPQFAPNIVIVKITKAMGDIQEGWDYDAETQTFTPPVPQPVSTPQPTKEEITRANLLETQYQTILIEMLAGF